MSERWQDNVRAALPRAVDVPELAAQHGMSRSRFSHAFKHATHALLHSTAPVAAIAVATGCANADHFGNVFRERFRLSPGAFRRQMGT